MFGGNAKTHFQMLGRGDNPTGYMMSPFGDERWDIDDQEKMKKIRQRTNIMQPAGAGNAEQCQVGTNWNQQTARELSQSGETQQYKVLHGSTSVASQMSYHPQRVDHHHGEQECPITDRRSYHQDLRTRYQYQPEENNQQRKYGLKNGLQDEAGAGRGYVCDSCQNAQARNPNYNWRSSPDVAINISGQNHYQPLGSSESTQSTFPQQRERNFYVPLS